MSSFPKDEKLYSIAKQYADLVYKTHSAYKSMAIQKKYIELYNEKYGDKNAYYGKNKGALSNWRNENWVDVESYLKGDIVPCGSVEYNRNKTYVACRPLADLKKYKNLDKILQLKKKLKEKSIDWEKYLK
jgi:hypothetical protein